MGKYVDWNYFIKELLLDDKFMYLGTMENRYFMQSLWVYLLFIASKNDNATLIFNDKPYPVELISHHFDDNLEDVLVGLNTFAKLGMITVNDDGFISIVGWDKFKTEDTMTQYPTRTVYVQTQKTVQPEPTATAEVTEADEAAKKKEERIQKLLAIADQEEKRKANNRLRQQRYRDRKRAAVAAAKSATSSASESVALRYGYVTDDIYINKNNLKTTTDDTLNLVDDFKINYNVIDNTDNNNSNVIHGVYIDNPKLYDVLKEYDNFRKDIKKPITKHNISFLMERLSEYAKSDEEKIEIVKNAIRHSWTDFYPITNATNVTPVTLQGKPKTDTFSNFEQRDYDYAEIEARFCKN